MSEPAPEQDSVELSREGYSVWHKMVDFEETERGLRVETDCGHVSPPGEAVDFQADFPPDQSGARVISTVCQDCDD